MNPITSFLDAMRRFGLAIREFEAKYDELITFHAACGNDMLQKGISSQILPLQHQLSRLLYSGESGPRQGSTPAQRACTDQALRAMEDAWNIMEKFRSEAIELMQHIGRANSHWIQDHSVQEMCAEIGIMWNSLEEFRSRVIGEGRQILPRLASPRSIMPRPASPRPMSRMMSPGMAAARRSPTPPQYPMAVGGSMGAVQKFIKNLNDFQIAFGKLKDQNPGIFTDLYEGLRAKHQRNLKDVTSGDFDNFRRALVELERQLNAAPMRQQASLQAKLEVRQQLVALMIHIREASRVISKAARELLAAKQHESTGGSYAVTDKDFKEMASCVTSMNKPIEEIRGNWKMKIASTRAMTLDQLFPRNPGSPR